MRQTPFEPQLPFPKIPALFLILILILIPPLSAQHNNRASRDLQFRFGNPGARSMGFGGAFIGLADDATAPVANPAGMVLIQRRSAAFEVNYNRLENKIPFQGGSVLQTNLFEFDFNLANSSAPEDIFQVPYLAVVLPKGKWRVAFFAHQQANLERRYTTEPILICDFSSGFHPNCENDPQPNQYPASTDVLELEIINAGFSFAFLFGERFSVGLSGFFSDMDYRADSTIVFPLISGDVLVDRFARGQDQDWGAVLGLLWRATDDLSFGLTYKIQPEFQYNAELTRTQPVPGVPGDFVETGIFQIPDTLGFGLSIRPLEPLTVNMDANRVYYSQVTDSFVDFTQVTTNDDVLISQTMPDITEIHLGLEWIFTQLANPLSLRLGYWLEPYHAMTNNVDDNQILAGPINKPFFRDIFFLQGFAEDNNHFAFGLGWTFGQRFQLDMAVETADSGENATVSSVYRF